MYYKVDDFPSVYSTSREVVTFRDYACHSSLRLSVICGVLTGESHSWNEKVKRHFGQKFYPITRRFELPTSVWLLLGRTGNSFTTPLVGAGHSPVLYITDNTAIIVERSVDI